MPKALSRGIAAASLAVALVFGCTGPRQLDQVGFGIWAADRNLWDEAIFRWKRVLAGEPGSVAAHNNLAVAYEKKALWEDARKEYLTALKLDPDNPWVKFNYARFRDRVDPDKKDGDGKAAKNEKE